MGNFRDHQKKLRTFVELRNWDQFHTPKNLAMALAGEVGELVAPFQWMESENCHRAQMGEKKWQNVREELADVYIYLLRLVDVLELDLDELFASKMRINEKNYPVELAKGHAKKYDELRADESRGL